MLHSAANIVELEELKADAASCPQDDFDTKQALVFITWIETSLELGESPLQGDYSGARHFLSFHLDKYMWDRNPYVSASGRSHGCLTW